MFTEIMYLIIAGVLLTVAHFVEKIARVKCPEMFEEDEKNS